MQVFHYQDTAFQFALDKIEEGYTVTIEYASWTHYGTPWHVSYVKG